MLPANKGWTCSDVATALGVGCPRQWAGWEGEGRQVVARMFFNTACSASNFVCWFITRPSPVGCVGCVRCVQCVRCGGWVRWVGWQGQKLSLCRDTVFNLAEGTIEGKVLSMYSWVPSAPPARRRTELGSSSLPPPSPPRAGNGLGGAAQACAEEAGGEAGRVVENGAPELVGPASDARGQLGHDQKASAKGRGKTTQSRAARG